MHEMIDQFGPVVDAYPRWHPLVASADSDRHFPPQRPSERCGYHGLDHTIFLRNAFISCPYDDASDVIASVRALKRHPIAEISAEPIDVPLYMPNAVPVLVKCEWDRPMASDGTIPKSIATALVLEAEVPCWRWSTVAETWDTMRSMILGLPCGSRSSLFVNQETGQTLKSVWTTIINTGMFGPIMVDRHA